MLLGNLCELCEFRYLIVGENDGILTLFVDGDFFRSVVAVGENFGLLVCYVSVDYALSFLVVDVVVG